MNDNSYFPSFCMNSFDMFMSLSEFLLLLLADTPPMAALAAGSLSESSPPNDTIIFVPPPPFLILPFVADAVRISSLVAGTVLTDSSKFAVSSVPVDEIRADDASLAKLEFEMSMPKAVASHM